jgi:hypothetical protein
MLLDYIEKVINLVYWFFVLVAELKETASVLMSAALKPNTHRTYSSAQNKYLNFCAAYNLEALPASEDTLLLYVAFLFDLKLKGTSIRVYLAAVRSLHIYSGVPYPVETFRLRLAVKGALTQSSPPQRKLPITFSVLVKLLSVLASRFDYKMISACMTLAFFGCFRCSELCVVDKSFDYQCNLCVNDVMVDKKEKMLSILLKKSKTDSVSAGVSVFVGCSGDGVCAFCSVVAYLESMPSVVDPSKCPFFRDASGHALTKSYFVSVTRIALALVGLDPAKFSGHSFRAGAATTAGDVGFSEWEIKMLGRWNSAAYNIYLRNPQVVSTFSKRLVPD